MQSAGAAHKSRYDQATPSANDDGFATSDLHHNQPMVRVLAPTHTNNCAVGRRLCDWCSCCPASASLCEGRSGPAAPRRERAALARAAETDRAGHQQADSAAKKGVGSARWPRGSRLSLLDDYWKEKQSDSPVARVGTRRDNQRRHPRNPHDEGHASEPATAARAAVTERSASESSGNRGIKS